MADGKIELKGLYKIFGSEPAKMLHHVRNGVTKQIILDEYNHVVALNDVNLSIPACGIEVIMGLSGSGKSTLIRHINRLIEPTTGSILVDNVPVVEMNEKDLRNFRRFKASMVFQNFALFPHRTAIENTAYGLIIQDIPRNEALERSQKWVERVGLQGFENYYPAQLSGGMQQRVGLARALATDADIMLMDEPFSALDPLIRTVMQDILLDLQAELQKTIIFISHDLDEALRLGDRIAILRDGFIVQESTPQDIILHPADEYVADFTKDINRGRVLQIGTIMSEKRIEADLKIEEKMVLVDVLQILSNAGAHRAVVTRESKPIGSIDMDMMIAALSGQALGWDKLS